MKKVNVDTGFRPRPMQDYFIRRMKRFNVGVCHRRFGKTTMTINDMGDRGLHNPLKRPQYAYIATTYAQAKKVAWDAMKDFARPFPGTRIWDSELKIEIPRPTIADPNDFIRFYCFGADNPDSIRGMYLDWATLDEFGDMNPIMWSQVVRPLLSDRHGGAHFIGTPKGANHFYRMVKNLQANPKPDWYVDVFKASETGIIDPVELQSLKEEMSEEEFLQEYECDFGAMNVGSFYGKILAKMKMNDQIKPLLYNPSVPVETSWDLGYGDTTVIWFRQKTDTGYDYIDYYENSGVGLEHYAKVIKEKPYVYECHILPHDAGHGSIDTGRRKVDTLKDLNIGRLEINDRVKDVGDRIEAVRVLLPKCRIDSVKCAKGVEALENYTKKYDSKNQVWSTNPVHNWASHGSDSFGEGAMFAKTQRSVLKRDLPRHAMSDYDIFGG